MENEAVRLFNTKLFQVLVPKISLYTEDEVRIYGFNYDIVDGKKVRADQYDLCNCMIPAAKILEIYSNGYTIRLVDKNKLNSLYKVLEGYLQYKYNVGNASIHRVKYDETELRNLDNFINEMFGYNKASIVKNILEIKNGFSLNLGFKPDKELRKSVHLDNSPMITEDSGSRYDKINKRLAARQQSNISNSPVIDLDSIKRNRIFE